MNPVTEGRETAEMNRCKLIGTRLAGKIVKWQPRESSLIGWLLQTRALIMIIFVNILLDKGIITQATFTPLLLTHLSWQTRALGAWCLRAIGGTIGR
jgi:hypothetical protein